MVKEFLIGCCYYPEHWNVEDLKYDLQRIKALGFNTVRMGEFSWSMYEKEEAQFDFSLMEKAVIGAREAGLYVILGTPTAAPPKWLTDRYPEVLCKNASGVTMAHGSRQHHNHTSDIYLKYCARITEEMVKAFCGFENVIGWQIDNELNCHRDESYSEADDQAFRKWLNEKYGHIEALNNAWGTRFWSMEFNSFAQIDCPRQTTTHKNPSLMTDYYLFLSDSVIHYVALQARIIKKYMPHAFITHNGYFDNIDYKKMTDNCLDVLSFDSYPAFDERKRLGGGRNREYRLAQTRGCSDPLLIMEQQSGPGGQLSYLLPTPLQGQIRLWTYQSIAHGATGIMYFRYRTALYGAEQLWYGIYDHDGEENHRSREIRRITQEISRCGHLFLRERRKAKVAILDDFHNHCGRKAEPFFANDIKCIFEALNQENVATDIIYTLDGLDRYKVVIIPHMAIADETIADTLRSFADKGGIVILSAKSGTKDKNAHYRPTKNPGVFREIAGCCVDWFTALPENMKQYVQMYGKRYPVELYYEALQPQAGEAQGFYTDGYCKGKTAVVKNGNVYYLGFFCGDSAQIYRDIVCAHIKTPEVIHEDLEQVELGAYTMYLNHGDQTIKLSGYDLLSESRIDIIEPFGVVLMKRATEDDG